MFYNTKILFILRNSYFVKVISNIKLEFFNSFKRQVIRVFFTHETFLKVVIKNLYLLNTSYSIHCTLVKIITTYLLNDLTTKFQIDITTFISVAEILSKQIYRGEGGITNTIDA